MRPDDEAADLSAYLDDALDPTAREAVRQRVERDPRAARTLAAYADVSALLRARFEDAARAAAAAAPELPPALAPEALRAVRAAARRTAFVRRALPWVAAVAILGAAAAYFAFRGDASVRAVETVAEAAKHSTSPEGYVEVEATMPAAALFTGKKLEVRGVLGPRGTFVGAVTMPQGTSFGGPFAALANRGDRGARATTLRAGFDGETLWRTDGERRVELTKIDLATAESASAELRRAFGADLLLGEHGPELGWSAWRDVAEGAANKLFEVTPAGERPFEDGKLSLFAIRAREGVKAPVQKATVGVDERGDLRLVEVHLFRILLKRLPTPPDPSAFQWRTYAAPDAEVREVELPSPSTRRGG